MGKRNWEALLFRATAIAIALWIAARAVAPLYRLRGKMGSWDAAWAVVAQAPGYWIAAAAVRLLAGVLLFWIALRFRRPGCPAGYAALLFAALLSVALDLVLWLAFEFG